MTTLLVILSGSLAASIVLKATVVMMLGIAAAWMARHQRAALRHAVLAASFAALLLVPTAVVVSPPYRIALAPAAKRSTVRTASSGIAAQQTLTESASLPASTSWRFSLTALLVAAWIGGAILFLAPMIAGLWRLRKLRRSAVPWRRDAGGVEVLLHEEAAGPLTCGTLRPAIILPRDVETWSEDDLNRALVHELEHVRRRDWLTLCAARGICAVYWFHPLIWTAFRRLAIEAERACDDAVLASSDAAAYADQLVDLARRLATGRSPLLAMANRSDLATRVHALLDARQRRGRVGRLPVALACASAALLVIAESPITVVAAPQTQTVEPQRPGVPRFTADSMLVIVPVIVTENGRPVSGLTAGAFTLTEDGADETITIFEAEQGSYVLGYYTRNDSAYDVFRKISVTCKGLPMVKLDYRAGYYSIQGTAVPVSPAAEAGVVSPVVLRKVEPAYSDEAFKAKYQGTVVLQVGIGADGRVDSVTVTRSLGLGLDERAIEAVKHWRFKPGSRDGQPVAMEAEVEMHFHLM